MKNLKSYFSTITLSLVAALVLLPGCKKDIEDLEPAGFPAIGEVFIDGFSAGLQYAAFGDSDVTAFSVDNQIKYSGSASMKFSVPDAGAPGGGYAGGSFSTGSGRDLSGFDALTFWARASKSATIDEIGFGLGTNEPSYRANLLAVPVNTNWKQYIIPIPDASKLTAESGLLYYAEAPEEGLGYTFWIDEVRFEKLGTIAHPKPGILENQDQNTSAETGQRLEIGGTHAIFNLPTGVDQRVEAAPAYFDYSTSNSSVATVSNSGVVTVIDAGEATITATLAGVEATGSLTVGGTGAAMVPQTIAPVPTVSADNVISLFSNAYTDVTVDTWNTGWLYSTATTEDITINGDDVKRYRELNFVGIEFTSQTIDISEMTHFHIDIWTPDPTDLPTSFKVLLVDFGADNNFDGGDDTSHELSFTSPLLATQEWVSIDVPLSLFTGLTSRSNLAQMVLSGEIPNVFVDNVYFYQGDPVGTTSPTVAAPTPTANPAEVISIFSDAYTNLAGSNLNPDWGQATVVSEVPIAGNNTLLYSGLNYQGLELDGGQDVSSTTYLHLDYWSSNSSALNTFLISTGPIETAYTLNVPTSGWASVDIPLSDFAPVDLMDVIQFKFEGNGDIYLDNIYFHNNTGGGGDEPTTPAPAPTYNAADVISIFSDDYTNVAGSNLNPDWGQATAVSEELIAGNNTLVYSGLNYQGLELASSIDVSGMTFLHLDFWTANSTTLSVFLISPGPTETAYSLTVPTSGWASIDIPLSDFAPVDLADVFQFKFEGDGDIYLDNILFRN